MMKTSEPNVSGFETKEAFYTFGDIRGFSAWSRKYQLDVRRLISHVYESAYSIFGPKKKQVLLSRVVKFLGDGFFAVKEYDQASFDNRYNNLLQRCLRFMENYKAFIVENNFHEDQSIEFSFGISYGSSERFYIQGLAFDYIGERINYSARLCGVAEPSQIVIDEDLIQKTRQIISEKKWSIQVQTDSVELRNLGEFRVGRISVPSIHSRRRS